MSSVTVRIPTPLRQFTGGADQVRAEGATVGDVLEALGAAHAGLLERVMNPHGEPRNFVNIYLGSENVRSLGGLETPVSNNDVISIVPAVAGGTPKGKDQRLAELKASIPEIAPADAVQLQRSGAAVIDVREADEIAQGSPAGAQRLGRGLLELRV
ncbi:MAG: MoaD/ThiS family protein, partial [Acidiferrobacterales bacterium]